MSRVLEVFADLLGSRVAPLEVGVVAPLRPADLPLVTLSLERMEPTAASIGSIPAPSRRGALGVTRRFDLATPSLSFPGGEVVDLLSGDRRRLHFPYGPVVAADGTEVTALAPADLGVAIDGSPLTVVEGDPGSGEVRGDPALGELLVGDPLPANGTLALDFFVGEWTVESERHSGRLRIEVSGSDAADTAAASEDVIAALHEAGSRSVAGLHRLSAVEVGAIGRHADVTNGRNRTLTYLFDLELETPNLGTGGGVVGVVGVASFLDGQPAASAPELFEVPA